LGTRKLTGEGTESYLLTPAALNTRRHTIGPQAIPQDLKPRVEVKSKNHSFFTQSLLGGDAPGYAHLQGGPKAKTK